MDNSLYELPVIGIIQAGRWDRVSKVEQAKYAIEEQSAADADEIGYMARAMIWASMPHSKFEGTHYKRNNGKAIITMVSLDQEIGLPYGKLPRLIIAWMTREAKRTNCRELVLGKSLNEFAGKLGLSTGGGKRGDTSRLKIQATKLFSTVVSLKVYRAGDDFSYQNVMLSDGGMLLWSRIHPNQPSLWESTITLSEQFFFECMHHAVPFDLRVLHALRSPLAIDIYMWLTWRVGGMRQPTLIPWKSLRLQLGAGYVDTQQGMAHFRAAFNRCLRDIAVLYPDARFCSEPTGLRLYTTSRPHIPKIPKVRFTRITPSLGARA